MPTLLPSGIAQGFGPVKVVQGGEFAYNSASGTYSLANIPPYTFVENVGVFVATVWSGGGAACMFIGDSLVTACYFPMVTLATAGAYQSFRSTQANFLGTLYTSANNITLIYTIDASDTQGTMFFYTTMIYLPDLSTGALVLAVQ